MSNAWGPPATETNVSRAFDMGASAKLNIKTDEAKAQVDAMAASMNGLRSALKDFGNESWNLADKINRNLKTIGETATEVTGKLNALTGAVAGASGGGARAGGGTANAVASPSSNVSSGGGSSSWVSSAAAAINSVGNKERVGGLSLGTFLGEGDDFAKNLVMAPLRYLRGRINTNRDTALMASGGLNMQAIQQGATTNSMMSGLGKFPGSIYGTPQDLVSMFASAPALGASYGFGTSGGGEGQGVRAAGFFRGVREAQMLNPLASVGGEGGIVSQIGGYAADTKAQQQAQILTGGAMGMIATGGRQKSLSEWAESILRWFEGLRPGANRGKGFDYGELMAQYFPGSNIDAWFTTTGVPQNMRDYWWTYALGKAKKTADTTTKGFTIGVDSPTTVGVDAGNVAWNRLKANTELTRTEFTLAGTMSGQYARREGANRWFNELIGNMETTLIPAISKSIFSWIQFLPDSIEDLLMTGAEKGMSKLLGDVPNASGAGDVGDIGDSGYGAMGGTGLGGLHPDLQSKIGKMMRANPRLRMTSGLRDTGLQKRLKDKGYSRVSGKSSAHTRGTAADLGPRSEYGWLVKNASKFGLASGVRHGEPWHVGMKGDIPMGDIGDPFSDFIGAMNPFDDGAEGMASMITRILDKITGVLGKLTGEADTQPDFGANPEDLYQKLAAASRETRLGLASSDAFKDAFWLDPLKGTAYLGGMGGGGGGMTSKGESVAGTPSGWAANNKTWRGTNPSGRGDRYNMVAPPDVMADIQSSDVLTRGKAVAKVLSAAGFTGQALKDFMRISYRESHWTANAWNSGPVDESGGILQANQLPWVKKGQPSPFTQGDLMDPLAAAHVAYDQYMNNAPLNGPGGRPTMSPWTVNGNWQGGIPAEASGLADQALKATGLGDIEAMQASVNMTGFGRTGGAGVNFNNVFNLSVPTYGGGSNGGIDVRRTVTLIADQLETEMDRRMKRSA